MQQYDIATKVLIESCRDEIVRYLMDLPVRESVLLDPLPQESVSLKRSDYPLMITDYDGNQEIAILEIQTDWKKTVPLNMIDYRVRYMLKYGVEARSCVVLLRPSGSASDLYEDRELRFRFQLVKIYEMDADKVVSEGPLCMLPFVPLMKGGERSLDQAESLIYKSERTRPEKADMLTSMAILSGLISTTMPAKLVARRKDIMIESAAYDIIKREGYEEGKQETMIDSLMMLLKAKFDAQGEALRPDILKIKDIDRLKALFEIAATASTVAEVIRGIENR